MIKKEPCGEGQLYDIWDRRWSHPLGSERLTFLTRLMFKAKNRSLARVLDGLRVGNTLEAGCGLGYTTQIFHDRGLDYTAIDVSPNAVLACKGKGLKAELKKLEEITEIFDLVFSDGMLEHFLNFEPYARHLMRVSRRYVLLIQPNHGSFWGRTFVYFAELFRGHENVFEYNYRIMDYIDLFKRNGFIIIENKPIFLDVFRLLLFEREGMA